MSPSYVPVTREPVWFIFRIAEKFLELSDQELFQAPVQDRDGAVVVAMITGVAGVVADIVVTLGEACELTGGLVVQPAVNRNRQVRLAMIYINAHFMEILRSII
jgi:hypothetical protein